MALWTRPQDLHVEPAVTADAEELARLHAAAFHTGWPREDFAAYLADPAVTPAFVICDARRRIAGFLMLRIAHDEAEVLTVAVDRKWRGKGLGGMLMRAALAALQLRPVRRLFLEVDESNLSALRLYRRHGFAEIGRRKGYYPRHDGSAATALVMARDLE